MLCVGPHLAWWHTNSDSMVERCLDITQATTKYAATLCSVQYYTCTGVGVDELGVMSHVNNC